MIQRRTAPKRSTKPIPSKRSKPRRGPMRSPEYRRWLHEKPCHVCGKMPCDPAHTGRNGGMSMKSDDSSCVPLCRKCHRLYDSDRKHFETIVGYDLHEKSAIYYQLFLKETKR